MPQGSGANNPPNIQNGLVGNLKVNNFDNGQRASAGTVWAGNGKWSNQSGVDVKTFGAKGDGTTDDTTAIQAAINSLSTTGGRVLFPVGVYKISSTLQIGNGNSTTPSTVNAGTELVGLSGVGFSVIEGGTPGAILRWNGASNVSMVAITGVINGCGVQNLTFDALTLAPSGVGLVVIAGCTGRFENLTFFGCNNSISLQSWDPFSGSNHANTMHNTFRNINISVPAGANNKGIFLDGGLSSAGTVTSDTSFCLFENITIALPNSALSNVAIYNRVCDSNVFNTIHILSGGSGSTGMVFDYSINTAYPNSNRFFAIDNSMSTQYANSGTPLTQNTLLNEIYGTMDSNGGRPPSGIANLAYMGPLAIGYTAPGVAIGGAVTQTTNINTPVTINNICGKILTVSNAWTAGTFQAFTVNNSTVAAIDTIILNVQGTSAGSAIAFVSAMANGSFVINIDPLATATFTVTMNFSIIKAVNT